MARPKKNGLSYFPLDVDFYIDNKFQMLLLKHSTKGLYLVLILLCKIYKEGYYYKWTAEERQLLARETRIHDEKIQEVVETSLNVGIFSKEKYEKYKILTSKGIQERYFEVSKRRKELEIIEKYIIKSDKNNNIKIVNATSCNTNEIQDVTSCNASGEQDVTFSNTKKRKENKSKEKKSKEKKSKEKNFTDAAINSTNNNDENYFINNNNDDLKLQDEKIEIIKSIFDKWNVFAIKHNLRTVKSLIGNGIKNILTRLDENEFDIDKILELSEQSEFLLTHGEKGKPITESFFTLQWIISDKRDESGMLNYEKILEGNYKNSNNNNQKNNYGTNRSRKGQSDFVYTMPD